MANRLLYSSMMFMKGIWWAWEMGWARIDIDDDNLKIIIIFTH